MRRFELWRHEDETGISGTGCVAEGVEFADGECIMRWKTERTSTAVYHSIDDLIHIHGHGGKTTVFWLDAPKYPHVPERDMELEGLCLMCFGGPFNNRDGSPGRYHHCFDCGASNYLVFIPKYAVDAIRKKDKQRTDSHEETLRELSWLRKKYVDALGPPDFVVATQRKPREGMTEEEIATFPEGYFGPDKWDVRCGQFIAFVTAPTAEAARLAAAATLPWKNFVPESST